jgi:hypothetical protein
LVQGCSADVSRNGRNGFVRSQRFAGARLPTRPVDFIFFVFQRQQLARFPGKSVFISAEIQKSSPNARMTDSPARYPAVNVATVANRCDRGVKHAETSRAPKVDVKR